MSKTLSHSAIDALLPPGDIWKPKSSGDFEKFNDAIGDSLESLRADLDGLAFVRDPNRTPYLSDLEKEYGIKTDENITEDIRRMQLSALVYAGEVTGSEDDLQTILNNADFDVNVYQNDPAVDPGPILGVVFAMEANGPAAFAGNDAAFAGQTGGDILANGVIYTKGGPAYLAQANGAATFAGNSKAIAGYFTQLTTEIIIYPVPTDPDSWPFVFFVGGGVDRDPVTDEILEVFQADVPSERKSEFQRLILKYKPQFTWAGLVINYT